MVRKSNGRSSPDRRARRATATREAILRAAAGVFRDRGFAETGMREIAAAADLSPGNLYYYFKSKADILYFCQDHSVDRMLATVIAQWAGTEPLITLITSGTSIGSNNNAGRTSTLL